MKAGVFHRTRDISIGKVEIFKMEELDDFQSFLLINFFQGMIRNLKASGFLMGEESIYFIFCFRFSSIASKNSSVNK